MYTRRFLRPRAQNALRLIFPSVQSFLPFSEHRKTTDLPACLLVHGATLISCRNHRRISSAPPAQAQQHSSTILQEPSVPTNSSHTDSSSVGPASASIASSQTCSHAHRRTTRLYDHKRQTDRYSSTFCFQMHRLQIGR